MQSGTLFVGILAGLQGLNAGYADIKQALHEGHASFKGISLARDRAFGITLDIYLRQLQAYGCWCRINGNITDSHGPVQDNVDDMCKTLMFGYRCLETEHAECNPLETKYNAYDFLNSKNDVVDECNDNNADDCTRGLCIVEATFAKGLLPQFLRGRGLRINPMLIHPRRGPFQKVRVCGTPPAKKVAMAHTISVTTEEVQDAVQATRSGSSTASFKANSPISSDAGTVIPTGAALEIVSVLPDNKVQVRSLDSGAVGTTSTANIMTEKKMVVSRHCCGEHPNKIPYNSADGSRTCCGGSPYAVAQHSCCDERIVDIGQC